MDKKSTTFGMLSGRQIAGMRKPKQEPVAYLYNGVRLPPLPDYDETENPNAAILQNKSSGRYYFFADAEEFEVSTDGTASWLFPAVKYELVDGVWTAKSSGGYNCTAIWGNFDIRYVDSDTVYLEKSEPVPVYE